MTTRCARNINLKTKAGFVRGFRTYNNGTSYGRQSPLAGL